MEKKVIEFEIGTIEEWKEQDKEVYEKILEKENYINVDHDWWDFELEYFYEQLKALGFENTDIRFSGFSSQGDGASFTGDWVSDRMWSLKTMKEKGVTLQDWALELRRILKGNMKDLKAKYETFSIKRTSHHYAHENTVSIFDAEYWNSRKKEQYGIPPEQEEDIMEGCRSAMREIHRLLENSYDYLTSDEAIVETLLCNGYKFDREGKIW